MNNVVDRVPTEMLANGAVRWEQFDSQGNSLGYVYLKRADEPAVVGTPINKVLFDSIQTDLTNLNSNKLNVSAKATTAQAQAGTNDTNYMTPAKTKAYIDYARGVHYTGIDLSSSTSNTINLSSYLVSNVEKLEVVINAQLASSYTALTLNGTNIRLDEAGGSTSGGSSSINVGDASQVRGAILKFSIYPDANFFQIKGTLESRVGSTVSAVSVDSTGNFISLSSIGIGAKNTGGSSVYSNYSKQVHIYQYFK